MSWEVYGGFRRGREGTCRGQWVQRPKHLVVLGTITSWWLCIIYLICRKRKRQDMCTNFSCSDPTQFSKIWLYIYATSAHSFRLY